MKKIILLGYLITLYSCSTLKNNSYPTEQEIKDVVGCLYENKTQQKLINYNPTITKYKSIILVENENYLYKLEYYKLNNNLFQIQGNIFKEF